MSETISESHEYKRFCRFKGGPHHGQRYEVDIRRDEVIVVDPIPVRPVPISSDIESVLDIKHSLYQRELWRDGNREWHEYKYKGPVKA